jgi:hypothetical protein
MGRIDRDEKWEKLKKWLTDEHYDVIHKQRLAFKKKVLTQIKDDQDILDVLDKMLEMESDDRHKRISEAFAKRLASKKERERLRDGSDRLGSIRNSKRGNIGQVS